MTLDAEAVRSRMNSGASPHHRIVFAKSEHRVAAAVRLAADPRSRQAGSPAGTAGKEASPVGSSPLFPRTAKNDPVMW